MTRPREPEQRVIAPAPERGPVAERIERAAPGERRRLRAEAVAEAAPAAFLHGRLEIVLLRPPVVRPDGVLEVWVEATRDGEPVAVDNPYLIVNPPVLVPDGTWRRESRVVNGRTEEVELPNFREDPASALRLILADALGEP